MQHHDVRRINIIISTQGITKHNHQQTKEETTIKHLTITSWRCRITL